MSEHPGTYDFPPFRPPNEASSALIKQLEEVKRDVKKARRIYGEAESIFLGDSDNLVHNDLPEIAAFIRETFPEAKRTTAYARAKTILGRKIEFLTAACNAGLDRLHIGMESGDAATLERLGKGVTPEEIVEAGRKAREAGFEVSFYVLSGAGGKDRWKEHAVESARVLNAIGPDFIRLRTLTIQHGTPLREKLEKGEFVLTPPLERLKEVRLFIETSDLESCYLASDHLTNYLWAGKDIIYRGVAGNLPDDKRGMLETLRQAVTFIESTGAEIKDSNRLYEEGIIRAL